MPRKIGYSTYSENFQGSDYTDEEWAFIQAIAAYQKRWKRRYPSWREVLHVFHCLGYRKVALAVEVDVNPIGSAIIDPGSPAPGPESAPPPSRESA